MRIQVDTCSFGSAVTKLSKAMWSVIIQGAPNHAERATNLLSKPPCYLTHVARRLLGARHAPARDEGLGLTVVLKCFSHDIPLDAQETAGAFADRFAYPDRLPRINHLRDGLMIYLHNRPLLAILKALGTLVPCRMTGAAVPDVCINISASHITWWNEKQWLMGDLPPLRPLPEARSCRPLF